MVVSGWSTKVRGLWLFCLALSSGVWLIDWTHGTTKAVNTGE